MRILGSRRGRTLAAFLLWTSLGCQSHPSDTVAFSLVQVGKSPFRVLDVSVAKTVAEQEGKPLMLYFSRLHDEASRMQEEVTWSNEAVARWIAGIVVAIKLDADGNDELAARYGVTVVPATVFVGPHGDHMLVTGHDAPKTFLHKVKDLRAILYWLYRTRLRIEGEAPNPEVHNDYARGLMNVGRHKEALEHCLWAWDNTEQYDPHYRPVKLSFLIDDIRILRRTLPSEVRSAMEARRERAVTSLWAEGTEADSIEDAVEDIATIDAGIFESSRTLGLLDLLRARGGRGGHAWRCIAKEVLPELIEERRYKDIIQAIPPEEMVAELRENLRTLKEAEKLMPELKDVKSGGDIDYVPDYYEALLGEKYADAAAELGRLYLEHCGGSGKAYATLVDRAVRAESLNSAKAWVDEGRRVLKGSDRRKLEKAAKRLDEASRARK